jgi:hypothetical protein
MVGIGPDGKPEGDTGQWQVISPDHGQESSVWSVAPKQDIVLQRDDYILIYISGIKTSLPSGLTNLYLDYKNIPGFWDGQVVRPIEKAPLLFYDVRAYSVPQTVQDEIARLEKQRQRLEGAREDFLITTPQSAHTPFDEELGKIAALVKDLAQKRQLQYTGELRVGIGCVEPEAKLEIALAANDADTKPLVIRKDKVNYLTVLKDGKVGIGNQIPQNRLHVGPGSILSVINNCAFS